ncbi:hypothetical protein BKA65DRAFT_580384 [Rhexocercosporidium sp. MPI-PUGE-AT-0058]|nr:hypothetical protein BKA65DRAFT_580384 [Rhexocercosporidium sp. MPI-PUGE-AT-0058]
MQLHCSDPSLIPSVCPAVIIREMLTGFHSQTLNKILALSFSTFNHYSDQTICMWNESTTTIPRVFRAAECWDEEKIPSMTKLLLSTIHHIESSMGKADRGYDVYRRSEQSTTVDPRLAIAQLVEPSEAGPVVLIGLNILPQGIFHVLVSLSEFVEGVEEDNQQLLLTPKYAFTDLHMDTSDGVSSPIGQCRKLWMVFPPTTKNLVLMKQAEGQRAKLDRIGKKLEGGLVFRTNSDEAIYLPAGCIHAVIPLQGGFLIATDFTTPLSSKPYAAMINAGLDDSGAADTFRLEVFRRFLSSVDYGLSCKHEALAITSWIGTLNIRRYAKVCQNWKKTAIKVWNEFFKKKEGRRWFAFAGCKERQDLKITSRGCTCGRRGKARRERRKLSWIMGKTRSRQRGNQSE